MWADQGWNRIWLKGNRMTRNLSSVMKQMMKADISVDRKARKPAVLHTTLFFHVVSCHR